MKRPQDRRPAKFTSDQTTRVSSKIPRQRAAPVGPFKTVRQIAQHLGLSERAVWRLIKLKRLKAYKFGGATRIFDDDATDFVRNSCI